MLIFPKKHNAKMHKTLSASTQLLVSRAGLIKMHTGRVRKQRTQAAGLLAMSVHPLPSNPKTYRVTWPCGCTGLCFQLQPKKIIDKR